ncbi:30S ribosomal protein S5, chloroplastic [Apostasia shenzhenica]|uniref:30S ribosomal protein S5, chloroplastic n=1 Tax=Apostasia shenzhenica TaxID=1088818 RepID=A0A2I0AYV3_9ASPA|nr:30S ribosomal protein S5, chloroplastic [Apostasia shenzhenica]
MAAASKARWARILYHTRCPARSIDAFISPNPRILLYHKPFTLPHLYLPFFFRHFSVNPIMGERIVQELLAEVEREKKLEREERKRKGLPPLEEEDEEDYMGVGPLIEKLERKKTKDLENIEQFWEPTDSDSDEDDERYSPEELKKSHDIFEKKCKRHAELLKNFAETETLDDAHYLMTKIDKFEEKHFKLPLEYRVIGDMMNRLKELTGKERFILLQKLNRAVRMMEIKEAYDPNNPANFGIIQHQQVGSPDDLVDNAGFEKEKQMIRGTSMEDVEEDFSESKDRDDSLMEKINAIEKKLEEKLALLDHTFGKKGRALEEEVRELVEERNALTEKKRRPLYRKGFDVKVIDVNRTCKVTKGGQIVKYTALLATGNFHGVVGFAKAKGPTAKIAIQKAYEKCFQNLHYVERYEDHTIAHAIQAKYEKTKIYLWPGPLRSGMSAAGKTVETILYLAGYSNVKSKIIGSRNPLNVIKALFIALNAIETPKDVQEKFGRTVVETYLL